MKNCLFAVGTSVSTAAPTRRATHAFVIVCAIAVLAPFVWGKSVQPGRQSLPQVRVFSNPADQPGVTINPGGSVLRRPSIAYPAEAKQNRIEGAVFAELTISPNGEVTDARAISGPDELRKVVLQSVLQWQYAKEKTPSRTVVVSVDFRLSLVAESEPTAQGSKIVFTGDREGQDAFDEIYVMKADGSGERRLPIPPHSCHTLFPRWSPNGHQIAFNCLALDNSSEVFVVNDDGTGLKQVTNLGRAGFASWSPDGKQIVFAAGDSYMYIVDLDSGALTKLVMGVRPDWSPDGKKITYVSDVRAGAGAIYVIELDDLEPVRLTDTSSNQEPRWSPNGLMIAFQSVRDGNREIYVMNADGSDQRRLTFYTGPDNVPNWSPDGRWIIFQRQLCIPPPPQAAPNGSDFFIIASDGSQEIQVTDGACPGGTFTNTSTFSAFASWSPGALVEPRIEP